MLRSSAKNCDAVTVVVEEIADELWNNDLEAQRAPITTEERVGHADGTLHTYLTTKFAIHDADDALSGTCAISVDITRWKQLEHHLARVPGVGVAPDVGQVFQLGSDGADGLLADIV